MIAPPPIAYVRFWQAARPRRSTLPAQPPPFPPRFVVVVVQVAARAAAALSCSKLIYLTFASLVSSRAIPAQPSAAERAAAHGGGRQEEAGPSDGIRAGAVVASGVGLDGVPPGEDVSKDVSKGRPDPLPMVQVRRRPGIAPRRASQNSPTAGVPE